MKLTAVLIHRLCAYCAHTRGQIVYNGLCPFAALHVAAFLPRTLHVIIVTFFITEVPYTFNCTIVHLARYLDATQF